MTRSGPQLLVFPDADRVEQHLLARASERGVADGVWVWSLPKLEEVCVAACVAGRRVATPLESRLVVAEVAQRLRPAVFEDAVEQPAFARAALGVFEALEAGGATAAELQLALQGFQGLARERLHALLLLWSAWRERMDALRWASGTRLLSEATLLLNGGALPPALGGIGGLEVRGIHDLTPVRSDFFLALAAACEREGIAFRMTFPGAGSAAIDAPVDPMLRRFESLHESLVSAEALKELPEPEERPFALLSDWLFLPEPPRGAIAHLAERAALWSAATAGAELDLLARHVLEQIEVGVPPEQLAVAFRTLGPEAEELAERLASVGIPARVRVGAPLTGTQLGRLALELPLLAEEDFPSGRLAALLMHAGGSDGPLLRPPSVLLTQAGVRNDRRGASAGQGAYALRLGQLAARLERAGKRDESLAVRQLAARCREVFVLCRAMPAEGTALELFEHWSAALVGLGLLAPPRESAVSHSAHRGPLETARLRALAQDQAAAEGLQQLVRALGTGLRQVRLGQLKMDRRRFARWLQDAAADLRVRAGGAPPGAVQILELRELVGREFTWVGIGGLVEGRLPGRATPHPLLDEEERRTLNQQLGRQVFRLWTGEDEGRASWHLAEDRYLFFQALVAATDGVSLGCARLDGSGREQGASPFLTELATLLDVEPRALPARVVALHEEALGAGALRERVALEVHAAPELRSELRDPVAGALAAHFSGAEWLLEAGRIARIEEERLRFFGNAEAAPGPHTGQVSGDGLEEDLRALFAFGPERPLSASALEALGQCRFRGFLRLAIGLGEEEAPGEELDARDRGTLHHRVMELLFQRLSEAGLLGRPTAELPAGLVDAVVTQAAEDVGERAHTGHPRLWELGRRRARTMAARVLDSEEHGLPFATLEPARVELAFGRRSSPEGWGDVRIDSSVGLEPIRLQGKIDRLDAGSGTVGVVDYKSRTKDVPDLARRLLVQDFQMPLYLMAARMAGHPEAREAAWISLHTGESVTFDQVLAKAGISPDALLETGMEARERARDEGTPNLANAVEALITEAREGRFPIRAADCEHCNFRPVCRITDRRLGAEEAG